MSTDSNGIRTAAEYPSSAFTFSTSNVNVVNYIPKTNMCPTKQVIKAALRTGYTLTIPTTYGNKQLVPNKDVEWEKNIGTLTIKLYTSSYLTSNGDTSTWLAHIGRKPTFTDSEISNNATYVYVTSNANNGYFSSATTSITLTLRTYETSTWPVSGTNYIYLSYVCYANNGGYGVLNGYYSPTEGNNLNSGTNVTASTYFSTTFVSQEDWYGY